MANLNGEVTQDATLDETPSRIVEVLRGKDGKLRRYVREVDFLHWAGEFQRKYGYESGGTPAAGHEQA